MPCDFFPRRDADAVAFTANFANQINLDPQRFHVTAERAAEYAQLQLAFAQAFTTASNPSTATRPATQAKRAARQAVEEATRQIGRIIRARPSSHWAPIFREADCCVTIVASLDEALSDPHFVERGLFARRVNAPFGAAPALPLPLSPGLRRNPDHVPGLTPLGADNAVLLEEP